jgi:uncharacterized protein YacL
MFSTVMPVIIFLGLVFFIIKFYIDFNHRVMFSNLYKSNEPRHNNYTMRSSMIKYLLSSCVMYLLLNTLVFNSSEVTNVHFYTNLLMLCVTLVVCVCYWKQWLVRKGPKPTRTNSSLLINEDLESRLLNDIYLHPLE